MQFLQHFTRFLLHCTTNAFHWYSFLLQGDSSDYPNEFGCCDNATLDAYELCGIDDYINLFEGAIFDPAAAVGKPDNVNPPFAAEITSQTAGTPAVGLSPAILDQVLQGFPNNEFTLAGWVRHVSRQAEYIFSIDENNSDHYFTVYITKNRLQFECRRPFQPGEVTDPNGQSLTQQMKVIFNSPDNIPDGSTLKPSGNKLSDGEWHFIAIVSKGRNMRYYLDGERFDPWSIIFRAPDGRRQQIYSDASNPVLELPYDLYIPSDATLVQGSIGGEGNDTNHNLWRGSVSKLVLMRRAVDLATLQCFAACTESLTSTLENTPLLQLYNPVTRSLSITGSQSIETYEEYLASVRYESGVLQPRDSKEINAEVSYFFSEVFSFRFNVNSNESGKHK